MTVKIFCIQFNSDVKINETCKNIRLVYLHYENCYTILYILIS